MFNIFLNNEINNVIKILNNIKVKKNKNFEILIKKSIEAIKNKKKLYSMVMVEVHLMLNILQRS